MNGIENIGLLEETGKKDVCILIQYQLDYLSAFKISSKTMDIECEYSYVCFLMWDIEMQWEYLILYIH